MLGGITVGDKEKIIIEVDITEEYAKKACAEEESEFEIEDFEIEE